MATQGQVLGPDEDGISIQEVSTDALAIINKSEIEQAVELAKRYPRDIEKVRAKLKKYSCLTPTIATTMFFSKPQGTVTVVGPGVRFAETLANCWTNTRCGVRIVGERGDVAVATGLFFDAETNSTIQVDAQRSILTKEKRRFSADMVVTTGNAAASIAFRNAIFRGIPRAMWDDIYLDAKKTAVGDVESFVKQVNTAVEEFSKQGVTQVMLLNFLGAPSVREINADHILQMRVVFNELRSGEKKIEDIFGSPEQREIDSIMEQLGWNSTKQRMSMTQYQGKPQEHLDYLRGLLPKADVKEAAKPQPLEARPMATTTNAETKPTPQTIPEVFEQRREAAAAERDATAQQMEAAQAEAPKPTPAAPAKRAANRNDW